MRGCRKKFGGDIHMFLIKDNKLVEKYNKIWDKVSNSIKKELDSEPVESVKYLGTKIQSFFFLSSFSFTVIHKSQYCRGRVTAFL